MRRINKNERFTRSEMERVLLTAGQIAHVSRAEVIAVLDELTDRTFPPTRTPWLYRVGHDFISWLDENIKCSHCIERCIEFPGGSRIDVFTPYALHAVAARHGSLCQICGDNTAIYYCGNQWPTFIHIGANYLPGDQTPTVCEPCFVLMGGRRLHDEQAIATVVARQLIRRRSPLLDRVRTASRLTYRFNPRAEMESAA